MATTITAKLTLTDSGSPYSASTSTPITLAFDYTEMYQQTIEVDAAGTGTIDLAAMVPKFFFFRLTTGAGTYVISDGGVGTSAGNLSATGGWVCLGTGASAGTGLDKIVYTATTDSVLEVLAYG
jgi:hypothetical protein